MIPFNKTEEQPVPPLIVQDEFGRKVFNAFTFAASPKESFSDITFGPDYSDPLLELCLFLCDNDPVARNHLLKWIACVKFLPETKPDHAILMHGPFGSGKSTLMEVLKRLVGPPLTTEIDQKLLSQPFNEYLLNCRLLVCEEIKALGDRALYNHLKPLITAKQHTINQKYANHFKVRNVTNCLFMSNFSNAIAVAQGDRRFFITGTSATESACKEMANDGYFIRLNKFLRIYDEYGGDCRGVWIFNKYLEEVILPTLEPNFAYRPFPETKWHAKAVESSLHPVQAFVQEELAIDSDHEMFRREKYFEHKEIEAALYREAKENPALARSLINKSEVMNALENCGYNYERLKICGDRKKYGWFDVDDWDQMFRQLLKDNPKQRDFIKRKHYSNNRYVGNF